MSQMVRKLKIAIVEDDLAMLSMLSDFLALQGHKILEFSHVDRLLEELVHDIDLIISNLHMPGKGGLDLLFEVKKRAPHIPVIVATAFGAENLEKVAKEKGASGILRKPFRLSDLVEAINRL